MDLIERQITEMREKVRYYKEVSNTPTEKVWLAGYVTAVRQVINQYQDIVNYIIRSM